MKRGSATISARRLIPLVLLALALSAPPAASAAPGDPDPSFAHDGITTTALSAYGQPYSGGGAAVVVLPDGKIVAGGGAWAHNQPEDFTVFALTRYLPNGQIDRSFGIDGAVKASFPLNDGSKGDAWIQQLALQRDGKIVAGGLVVSPHYSPHQDCPLGVLSVQGGCEPPVPENTKSVLARYLPNGSLDQGFGDGGTLTIGAGAMGGPGTENQSFGINDLALDSEGRIVVLGMMLPSGGEANPVLLRYTPSGQFDQSFGVGGMERLENPDEMSWSVIAVQPNDEIVLAGTASTKALPEGDSQHSPALARYLPNGLPDPSFGVAGVAKAAVPADGGDESVADVALQADGRIVTVGTLLPSADESDVPQSDLAVVRWLPDGSADPSFAEQGQATIRVFDASFANAVVIEPGTQGDHKILVTGGAVHAGAPPVADFSVVRYLGDGRPDPAFGDNGVVTTQINASSVAAAAALYPDSRLIVTGSACRDHHNCDAGLARYELAGATRPASAAFSEPEYAHITPPQQVGASAVLDSIELRWSPPAFTPGAPLTRYEVWRANCEACDYTLLAQTTSTSYGDSLPILDVSNYHYSVRAENSIGELSRWSNVAVPVPVPLPTGPAPNGGSAGTAAELPKCGKLRKKLKGSRSKTVKQRIRGKLKKLGC